MASVEASTWNATGVCSATTDVVVAARDEVTAGADPAAEATAMKHAIPSRTLQVPATKSLHFIGVLPGEKYR